MTRHEDGHVAVRGDGVGDSELARGHLQFVGHRGGEHAGRRRGLVGLMSLVGSVVHAVDGLQRLSREPLQRGDAVVRRRSARDHRSGGRSPIDRFEGLTCIGEIATARHETLQAVLAIQRRESFEVVGAELVNKDVDHQARLLGCGLRLDAHHGHEGQERCQPSIGVAVVQGGMTFVVRHGLII